MRRWRGSRAVAPAAVDETPAAVQAPADAPGAEPAAAGIVPEDFAAAVEAGRRHLERADKLQGLYDVQIRRADDLERALIRATARIEEKGQAIAALEGNVAKADRAHGATCAHAAEVRDLRATMAKLQDRLDELQAANEGHDRWAARQVTT